MDRRRLFLEGGLRLVSNKEIIATSSDANLVSFRNIKDIYQINNASISELIKILSCRLAGVVRFQSCTPV